MKSKEVFKRLIKFLKPYKIRFAEAMLSMVVVAALTSGRVYLLKPGLDKLIETRDMNLLKLFVAVILLITVLHAVFSYIQNYILAYIGQHVVIDLRNETYAHTQRLSLAYFLTRPTGAILSRLTNDIMYIQGAITSVPSKIIKDGLSSLFILGLLFYLNWKWTLASLIFFPFIVYPIGVFARKMRTTALKTQEKMAEIYSLITEKISGIKVTKAFAQEISEIDAMKKVNTDYFNVIMKLLRAMALQRPVMEIITYFISTMLAAYVVYSIFQQTVSVGSALAFLAALMSFYSPIKNIADLNKEIQTSASAAERIFSVIDTETEVAEKPDAAEFTGIEKNIRFENVSFSYSLKEGSKIAIRNISMKVKKGEIFALVGPSGGGKTTIANLIPRFFDPTDGRITIDGVDIRNFKISTLRKKIGIVSQDVMLFRDTVRNNIAYGYKTASDAEVSNAAKLANADEFIKKLPGGYDTVIGERGATLSGGQAQRICIARAIIGNPPILILDEATSSLDTESEQIIQEAFKAIQLGRTTVVIAHRLSTVRRADRIVVISSGRIVEEGQHVDLIALNGFYKRLYDLQFKG